MDGALAVTHPPSLPFSFSAVEKMMIRQWFPFFFHRSVVVFHHHEASSGRAAVNVVMDRIGENKGADGREGWGVAFVFVGPFMLMIVYRIKSIAIPYLSTGSSRRRRKREGDYDVAQILIQYSRGCVSAAAAVCTAVLLACGRRDEPCAYYYQRPSIEIVYMYESASNWLSHYSIIITIIISGQRNNVHPHHVVLNKRVTHANNPPPPSSLDSFLHLSSRRYFLLFTSFHPLVRGRRALKTVLLLCDLCNADENKRDAEGGEEVHIKDCRRAPLVCVCVCVCYVGSDGTENNGRMSLLPFSLVSKELRHSHQNANRRSLLWL